MASIQELQNIASQMRRDIVRMVHGVQSGHPGGSLGCADYFAALFFHIMKHDTKFSMDGKNEDLFFLSNGHISPVYYSALARSGYFEVKELASFRKINCTGSQRLTGTRYECCHRCSAVQKIKQR
jgi:transketolase